MTERVTDALVAAGIHYARRDYDAAEEAILGALSGVRKERSEYRHGKDTRIHAE